VVAALSKHDRHHDERQSHQPAAAPGDEQARRSTGCDKAENDQIDARRNVSPSRRRRQQGHRANPDSGGNGGRGINTDPTAATSPSWSRRCRKQHHRCHHDDVEAAAHSAPPHAAAVRSGEPTCRWLHEIADQNENGIASSTKIVDAARHLLREDDAGQRAFDQMKMSAASANAKPIGNPRTR